MGPGEDEEQDGGAGNAAFAKLPRVIWMLWFDGWQLSNLSPLPLHLSFECRAKRQRSVAENVHPYPPLVSYPSTLSQAH